MKKQCWDCKNRPAFSEADFFYHRLKKHLSQMTIEILSNHPEFLKVKKIRKLLMNIPLNWNRYT